MMRPPLIRRLRGVRNSQLCWREAICLRKHHPHRMQEDEIEEAAEGVRLSGRVNRAASNAYQ
jgi:hypothetical protein